MELIDNKNKTLRDDFSIEITKGSKLTIAAACFSIYAFKELKSELNTIDNLRFIFTSPTFVTEKAKKEKREFYIPRLNRERSLYGTEFEVKLRNKLTQKAIAKECADWIRNKVTFKSNITGENMMGFVNLDDKNYMPINGFTTVDIEDMSSGISIMDLGLNEFRLDLLEYVKHHEDIDKIPFGLHAVVPSSEEMPAGAIYVLKNRSNSVNINNQNRLHPFYMVYVSKDDEILCNHLAPKTILDKMRFLCRTKTEPIPELYQAFNKETKDGNNMKDFSKLLCDAIISIIEVNRESDIESFLGGKKN